MSVVNNTYYIIFQFTLPTFQKDSSIIFKFSISIIDTQEKIKNSLQFKNTVMLNLKLFLKL